MKIEGQVRVTNQRGLTIRGIILTEKKLEILGISHTGE